MARGHGEASDGVWGFGSEVLALTPAGIFRLVGCNCVELIVMPGPGIRDDRTYAACGSGEAVALGTLYATHAMSVHQSAIAAVNAATYHVVDVALPLDFIDREWTS